MERFVVRRGHIKKLAAEGGLNGLGTRLFDSVGPAGEDSFTAAYGILTKISAEFTDKGMLVVDVEQRRPDFDDTADMEIAMNSRKAWSTFLDEATDYNSKQRGDKAKELAKKRSKSKSAISQAEHFMKLAKSLDQAVIDAANSLIDEIHAALEEDDIARANGRGEKLTKLLSS
jgi:hypothetical protein